MPAQLRLRRETCRFEEPSIVGELERILQCVGRGLDAVDLVARLRPGVRQLRPQLPASAGRRPGDDAVVLHVDRRPAPVHADERIGSAGPSRSMVVGQPTTQHDRHVRLQGFQRRPLVIDLGGLLDQCHPVTVVPQECREHLPLVGAPVVDPSLLRFAEEYGTDFERVVEFQLGGHRAPSGHVGALEGNRTDSPADFHGSSLRTRPATTLPPHGLRVSRTSDAAARV